MTSQNRSIFGKTAARVVAVYLQGTSETRCQIIAALHKRYSDNFIYSWPLANRILDAIALTSSPNLR